MNVLIMSVRAGYGHHSTAKAIIEYFEPFGHKCEMLDIFDYINRHLGNTVQNGYLLSSKYLSSSYGRIYSLLNEKNEPTSELSITTLLTKVVSKKLENYVKDFKPDVIISTHSYAGVVMSILAKKKVITCPTFGVVTDFTVHPFWESTFLDYYVIPNELLTWQMTKKGISERRLLPFGIPVRKCFSTRTPKNEARSELGLKQKPTILVMMGSMGYGNIAATIEELDNFKTDFQVLCVCGSNEKMRKELLNHDYKKDIHIYGFVNNVDKMMDASDLIISKPGGLTSSEAFAKGLPMITMNPLPGQEDRNTDFLSNCGAIIQVNARYHLSEALNQVYGCNWRFDQMCDSIEKIGKPNAAKDLYEFIVSLQN